MAGGKAWVWLAMKSTSRRLLAVRLSWKRNILVAYNFLKHLRERYGVRVVVVDGAKWYLEPCLELGIRRIVQCGGFHNIMERLSKEVRYHTTLRELYATQHQNQNRTKCSNS